MTFTKYAITVTVQAGWTRKEFHNRCLIKHQYCLRDRGPVSATCCQMACLLVPRSHHYTIVRMHIGKSRSVSHNRQMEYSLDIIPSPLVRGILLLSQSFKWPLPPGDYLAALSWLRKDITCYSWSKPSSTPFSAAISLRSFICSTNNTIWAHSRRHHHQFPDQAKLEESMWWRPQFMV